MTQVIVSATAVDVTASVYDLLLLDSVRGCLEGETSDYFFCQLNSEYYALIISDNCNYDNGWFTAETATVIQFQKFTRDLSYNTSAPISGTNSGQFAGFENAGQYNGSFTGSIQQRVYNTETYYKMHSYQAENIIVRNPDEYMVYGSFEGLPHLIEGVQNYAYLQIFLIVGIVLFKLCDRIFRRVY